MSQQINKEKNTEKMEKDQESWVEHHSGKDFLNMVYFLGPWVDDGQGLTSDLKAVQSFWAGYIRGEGQLR